MTAAVGQARRVGVVGGGWAGIAAAVRAVGQGDAVTLFEMAPRLGGRARAVNAGGQALDNGQHILIGAYTECLRLMTTIGVDTEAAFLRLPLRMSYPDGGGLQLAPGPAVPAFVRAVWQRRGWPLHARVALLVAASGWMLRGFRCEPNLSVAALTARLPRAVRTELIDPLCVAALNTPAAEAGAQVFLRVLRDALLSGPGSSDLLLPRVDLSALLAEPAAAWLAAAGATLRLRHRVGELAHDAGVWRLDDEVFDHVVLACTPQEAARLTDRAAPAWSRCAAALRHEPIATVYLLHTGLRLGAPLLALHDDAESPAQFVFDRGQLGGPAGQLAFVVSGAAPWVARGTAALEAAVRRQAHAAFGIDLGADCVTLIEKRATFRSTPGLARPASRIAPGLTAAGDHVAGPYPATLEGAVRSGRASVAPCVSGARTAPPAARR